MSQFTIATVSIVTADLVERVVILRSRSENYTKEIELLEVEGKRTAVIAVTHLSTFTRQLEDSKGDRSITVQYIDTVCRAVADVQHQTIFTSRSSLQRKALSTLVDELHELKSQSSNLKKQARTLQEQVADMFAQAGKTKNECAERQRCAGNLKDKIALAKEGIQSECQLAMDSAGRQQVDVNKTTEACEKYTRKSMQWDEVRIHPAL
jgi:uncharacterized coiled-coil DUF342 family protein